jgi:hypothetical protein
MTEEKLENTELAQKVKRYFEQWEKDKELREKEIEGRKEQSIFEDTPTVGDEHKERGLLTHPVNPLSEKHPHFKSLTLHQVEKIEQCCEEGLSIRSIKKALHVFENIDVSYGTLQEIRKGLKEKVSQSS